jgi:glyoxylase-like metal-dependent hydrolase (beta-lactamase superfamily II)
VHVVRLGAATFCLRQDKCATFEAPFLYLLVGSERCLLIDSGDVDEDAELLRALQGLVAGRPLLIANTHPHSDHVRGNQFLTRMLGASVVATNASSLIDLGGGRIVEVISAGKGHSDNDMCFLDSESRLLFTGDVLYPGYIYIRRFDSYREGILALWARAWGRFDYSLGAHVEMMSSGALFESGARHQPGEMPIQQPPLALELLAEEVSRTRFVNPYFALTPKANL